MRGLDGCLPLLRAEVRWHCDDCLAHVIIEVALCSLHQRFQNLCRHLLWVEVSP